MRIKHLIPALATLLVCLAGTANAQIRVLSNSVQEREVEAGASYAGEIRVRNDGTEPRGVRVYQTDYLFYADGSNSYAQPGSHGRSNAGWITVTPTDVVIPAGQAADITYRVTVPADPSLGGTYWSMVMVEPTAVPTSEPEARQPGLGLRTTIRFGIQIATHVPGEAEHRLRLGNPQVVLDDAGSRNLQFELVNDGGVAYRPKVSLEVYDRSGGLTASMEAQRGLIYPGTSALQRFEFSELPAGEYQAVVVVDTGALEVFGAQFNLTVGDTG
jgi:hypothetical protein